MVAHSGRGWSLAPCLIALEHEADSLAPGRSRESDGSIGDAEHASRSSDHNPDGGYVHALDLTHDPAHGFDAHAHARATADRPDPRIKYVITQGRIWDPVRGWHAYTGANRHDHHAHWSVLHTQNARNNLERWLVPVIVTPTPTPTPVGVPDMFVVISGVAALSLTSNVLFSHSTWESFLKSRAASPDVPMQVIGDWEPLDARQHFYGELLKQHAAAVR